MDDKLKKIYDYLSTQNIKNFPSDYNSFVGMMQDDASVGKIHDYLLSQNIKNVDPDVNVFKDSVGLKKKEQPIPGHAEGIVPAHGVESEVFSQETSQSPSGQPIEPKQFTTPSTELNAPDVTNVDVTKQNESLLNQHIDQKETARGAKENTFAFFKEINKGLAGIFDAVDYIQTSAGDALNEILLGKKAAYDIKSLRDEGINLPGEERPFKAISDAINWTGSGTPDLPNNIGGDIAKGVAGTVPLVLTSLVAPEVKAGQLLQQMGIQDLSKFGLVMGTQQAIQASEQSQNGTPLQRWTAPALAGLEGYLTGWTFDNMGAMSSKLGERIANKVLPPIETIGKTEQEINSQLLSKAIVQTSASNLTNAVFFGGFGNMEEYLQTGQISPETFATNAGIGLVMGARETGKLLWAKGMNSLIATPADVVSRTMDSPVSAEELANKAHEKINLVEKGESTDKELDLTSAMINAKASELKAVTDEIKENPQEVIKSVQESTLDNKVKELVIDKVNEVVAANDPKAKEAKPLTDKIDEIDASIDNIKNNKSLSSVEKEIKTKELTDQRDELKKQVVEIYNKPIEETKTETQTSEPKVEQINGGQENAAEGRKTGNEVSSESGTETGNGSLAGVRLGNDESNQKGAGGEEQVVAESGKEITPKTEMGFTESVTINEGHRQIKAKIGEKKAKKYFEQVDRLINPNKNTIVEYRTNGVVTKEGDAYIFHPLADMELSKWRLAGWKTDVTDQFVQKPKTFTEPEQTAKANIPKTSEEFRNEIASADEAKQKAFLGGDKLDDFINELETIRKEEEAKGSTEFFDSEVKRFREEQNKGDIQTKTDEAGNEVYMANETPGVEPANLNTKKEVKAELERLNSLSNTKAEILNETKDIPSEILKESAGGRIWGYHLPGAEKSTIIAGNIRSVEEARKIWIHELTHAGIERVFGSKSAYDTAMKSVIQTLGGKWKAIDKIKEMGGNPLTYGRMSESAIGEEYLAFLSNKIIKDPNLNVEKILSKEELPIWQKIVTAINDYISKTFGIPQKLSDADIANMIIDAVNAGKKGGESFRKAGEMPLAEGIKGLRERYEAFKVEQAQSGIKGAEGTQNIPEEVQKEETSKPKPEEIFERETMRKMRDESTLSPKFKEWLSGHDITTTRLPNDVTSKEVDYLIAQNGLDKAKDILHDKNNNLSHPIRNLLGVRLTKAYDDVATAYDKAGDETNGSKYRQKAFQTAEWIENETTDIARGLQILAGVQAKSVLSPKSNVIDAVQKTRAQRDEQINRSKKDIDKKSKILKDVQEETVNKVLASDAFRNKKRQTESKYRGRPQTSVSKAKLLEEKNLRSKLWEDFKKAREEAKSRGESFGLAATPLHAEEVRIAGEITRSLIRSGYYKMQDIIDTIKAEWRENLGESVSDEYVRKLIPVNLNDKPIEEVLIDNYNQKAVDKLAVRIDRMFDEPKAKKDDPLVQMVNTLFEKVSEKANVKKPEVAKKPTIEKIKEAISDKKNYASVWESAKNDVKDRIDLNSELSEEQKADRTKQLDAFYNEIIGKPYSDKQVQDIVRGGLKDMDAQIDDVIRKHYTVYDATKKTLQDKLVDELGLDGEDAKLLADAIGKEFDKVATARKMSALKRGITPKEIAHPARTKATWEKLVELSNMGAWSDAEMSEAYADKMGFPKLTDENKKEIERLANRVQQAPSGEKKYEAIQDLLAYQAKLPGIDVGRIGESMWYSFILSGFRTQFKNVFANNMNILSEFLVSARDPRNIPSLLLGLSSGTRQGFRSAGHIIKTGYEPIRGTKVESPGDLELWKFKGGGWNPANWAKYVTRVMVAADAISYHGLKEMRSWELAMQLARTKDIKAQYPDMGSTRRAMEILNKTNEKLIEYGDQAKSEGLKGHDADRRIWELMEQERPVEMVDDANNFAARGTFNHAPEGTMGILTELVGFAANNVAMQMPIPLSNKKATLRPLKVFVPFTRIISNVTNVALDYTPYGFVRAAKGGVGFTQYERPGVARVVGKGKYREYTADERQRTLTKAIMGVSAMTALYLLSADRDDDKEPSMTITANGTGDYATNTELTNASGWQPYSIKVNDKWYSYQYTPLFLALAPIGYLRDAEKYQKEKTDAMTREQKFSFMAMQTSRAMMDMSWMTNLTGLMDGLSSTSVGSFDSFWQKQTASFIKSAIYPKIVDQTVQFIDYKSGNPRHDSGTMMGKILKDVPIVRDRYNRMLNAVGEPVLYDPVQMMSDATSDPFWEFVVNNNAFIGKPSQKKIKIYDDINKTDRFLTDDEYYDYIRLTGSAIKSRIESEVMGQNMKQEDVKDAVDKIKQEERKRVTTEMFGWGDFRMKHPDQWLILRDKGGLQNPMASKKVNIGGELRPLTQEELKRFNEIAVEKYAEMVIPYLKNTPESDKEPIAERPDGKSIFTINTERMWDGARASATADIIDWISKNESSKPK